MADLKLTYSNLALVFLCINLQQSTGLVVDFEVHLDKIPWQEAKIDCENRGGSLATIRDDVSQQKLSILIQKVIRESECTQWIGWHSTDYPSGGCDCELISGFLQRYDGMCAHPTRVEARTTIDKVPAQDTEQVIMLNTEHGFRCGNADQGSGPRCLDYEARYCCPEYTFWIGVVQTTGTFKYEDGSSISYANWKTDAPNDVVGSDCVRLNDNYEWENVNCNTSASYICEFIDICLAENHMEINDRFRSIAFNTSYFDNSTGDVEQRCDANITQGWYRFTHAVGGEMPTECVGMDTCGTTYPVWIDGTMPTDQNITVQKGCINTGQDCCDQTVDIAVKNCGDFLIYNLKPLPDCAMGYCAGDKEPCPPGERSPNIDIQPGCTDMYPSVDLEDVKLNVVDVLKQTTLLCSANGKITQNVEYFCDWYADDEPPITFTPNQSHRRRRNYLQSFIDKHTKTDADEPFLKIGQTVKCVFYAKYSGSNVTSPPLHSEELFIGLNVNPKVVIASEDGAAGEITVTSTVPMKCDFESPLKREILLSTCTISIKDDPSYSEEQKVQIHAVRDCQDDGAQVVRVEIAPTSGCSLHYNESYKQVVYVDIRTKECWSVSCHCGVAIREDNDVLSIDMCHAKADKPYPRIQKLSREKLSKGVKITRDKGGKTFHVTLASGTSIRIEIPGDYMNIYLEVVGDDFNKSQGLCGNFDDNRLNDFMKPDGTIVSHDTRRPDTFSESWRIKDGESLFDRLPAKVSVENTPLQQVKLTLCSCLTDKDDCSFRLQGSTTWNVKYTKDITHIVDNRGNGLLRKKRSVDDENTVSWYSYTPDPDFVPANITWPTPNNITKSMARHLCKSVVLNSTATDACSEIAGVDLFIGVEGCVEDIGLTDDLSFLSNAVSEMENQCEEMALKNLTLYYKDENGTIVGPPEFLGSLICPGQCSGNGECMNGTCHCTEGFSGADCSIDSTEPPELWYVNDEEHGICDVREKNCQFISVVGNNILDSENLVCMFEELSEDVDSESVKRESRDLTRVTASMVTFREVLCQLEAAMVVPGNPDEIEGITFKTITLYLSNNAGDVTSNGLHLTTHDSKCRSCNARGQCRLKDDTCDINGHCFSDHENHPEDPDKTCSPSNDQHDWTIVSMLCKFMHDLPMSIDNISLHSFPEMETVFRCNGGAKKSRPTIIRSRDHVMVL
ncbi:von Willebrand factor D and EGF domain-containing protein-like [Glandiceps talaboti]